MNKLKAFLKGACEFRRSLTWADPARIDGLTSLDMAYDRGREVAHCLTFRQFEMA